MVSAALSQVTHANGSLPFSLASQIQEIGTEEGSVLQEYIRTINSCYPEEIVR